MKKILLYVIMMLSAFVGYTQKVYEDFESGTPNLTWKAFDGVLNGVIANPGKDAVNGSDKVLSYKKSDQHEYSLLLAESATAFDLSTNNLFKIKIWSPVKTGVLLKLEGTGGAIEKRATFTESGKWVEYTFDMSGASSNTGLTKMILFFDAGQKSGDTYLFDDIVAVPSSTVLEDFETTAKLPWKAYEGVYDGVITNPKPNKVNNSPNVGSYTKSKANEYSFFVAELTKPLDLSVMSKFRISVYAGAATQFLMKLEGADGAAEEIKNIAIANTWQEYTFDFSKIKDKKQLTKLILFFDPGVKESGDTYLFDNIIQEVGGPCEGVVRSATMIDDFECQRNATYNGNWDSLSVVINPSKTVDNNSAMVGKYIDPVDEEWAFLMADYQNPMDLSVNNNIRMKIWSPKVGKHLFKLEGGLSPAKEVWVDVTEPNKWVTYTVDFSSEAASNHKKIVIFFNASVKATAGDIYYIDDFERIPRPTPSALEDFEPQKMAWAPLNGSAAIHGVFEKIANPGKGGTNSSDNVGSYKKGSSAFSTISAALPAGFKVDKFPQLNLDVWAPAGAKKVKMQLTSITQGNVEVERDITKTAEWVTLSFDFSKSDKITDFTNVNLIFDSGVAEAGKTFYFDNLQPGVATVDPCEGTVRIPQIVADFECQRTKVFYGDTDIKAINNPKLDAINSSLKVGEYTDAAGQEWNGLGFDNTTAFDLKIYNQLTLMLYMPEAAELMFKLEGGKEAAIEIRQTFTEVNKWQKINLDFSKFTNSDHQKLVIFFEPGKAIPATKKYYIDQIRWRRTGYNGCISDYETPSSSISNFKYFANGTLEKNGIKFEIVDNPKKAGINASAKVGKFVKAGDSDPWAGMYADLDAAVAFKGTKTISAKVLLDHIGNLGLKLEGSATGKPNIELKKATTKVNEWETVTIDFTDADDAGEYMRFTLFVDFLEPATGKDVTSYFDDIVIGAGSCGAGVGIFEPTIAETLKVAPNPTNEFLTVYNTENLSMVAVYDLTGRLILKNELNGSENVTLFVGNLPQGMYTMIGYNAQGIIKANTKFVKE
ncbi:MAG: T9SS type A sorting domain-containing protein [Saprospiraceae bacterium]